MAMTNICQPDFERNHMRLITIRDADVVLELSGKIVK